MTEIKLAEKIITPKMIGAMNKLWPGHGERFLSSFITYQRIADAKSSRKIMNCSPASIIDALSTCAQLQLMPSSTLPLVYFIPYNNKHTGIPDCTFMIGYQGIIEVVMRNPKVKKIEAALVREGETYIVKRGTDPAIIHEVDPVSDKKVVAGYAITTFEGGEKRFSTMSRREIDAVAATAKSDKFWGQYYNEMATKTLIRREWKFIPKCGQDICRAPAGALQISLGF